MNASTPSCGNASASPYAGLPSNASCPSNWRMTGGGYSLVVYSPLFPNNASNSPDSSIPITSDTWSVVAGGAPGASCFLAFAVCIK